MHAHIYSRTTITIIFTLYCAHNNWIFSWFNSTWKQERGLIWESKADILL